MGNRPEEMERWGATSIFKESARLLHKHYRLFLPFFLAFYLPISIFAVYETLFLSPSSAPLLVEGSVNTAQTSDPPGGLPLTTIFSGTLFFLMNMLVEKLGTGAVFYITDYLYTPTRTDDDPSIVPKVFKFLPGAFLRMFTTQLWTVLADLLLCLFSVFIGGILYAAGWSDLTSLFVFAFFIFLAGDMYLIIVFALAQVIAVLEPGNYGRKALKRSTKLARFGRVWTIVAVTLTGSLVSAGLTVLTNGIMTGGMPVWAKVALIVGVNSVFRVYFRVVSVVMYFVYKARFDAAGSAGIPVFKRVDSAEHLYDPIVEGKGSVTYVG